jgi:predicted nucleotidyltransferase
MNSRTSPPGSIQLLESFLERVRGWARARPDIVAILLVGSWARGQARAGSDVDLVILAQEPGRLLADRGWLEELGKVRAVQEEDWGRVRSLRVFHESGLEVEYGLTEEGWLAEPLDPGTEAVLADGVTIVHLRDDLSLPGLELYLSPDSGQSSASSIGFGQVSADVKAARRRPGAGGQQTVSSEPWFLSGPACAWR